uniref:tRNA(Ile)-lysidine synthase, chloroplastic n=1 Tax=Chloropicon maureeniae TaxID=1461542 RepID=A0A4D6C3J8_9CHLO|nr:tRNA(Ile)-lysidine synthetase [Chloropicon maureeniae]QBX98234.1 tRNA(Ile)-lysidine synthetase [Chloropicon maureeniae]
MPIKRILYTLSTTHLFDQNTEFKILIAISGGQDSTCLASFILICQKLMNKKKRIQVGLIHCQHLWGMASLEMANQIDSWVYQMKKLNIDVVLYSALPIYAVPSESASRSWRIKLFNRIAKIYNYNLVLTGHTLNDQIETFLSYQIIRGFYNPLRQKVLTPTEKFKPFFWITRHEVWLICSFWHFPVFADSSNKSLLFTRSRLRLELIPILKAFYNPQVENSLFQNILVHNEKTDFLKSFSSNISLFSKDQKVLLNRFELLKLPRWVQREIWLESFQRLGVYHIGFYWIEKCLLYSKLSKNFHFRGGIVLKSFSDWLILSKNQNQL